MISSRFSGFSSFMKLFIPPLSSWNTPSVRPVPMDSKHFFIIIINMVHIQLDAIVFFLPDVQRSGSPSVYEDPKIHFNKPQLFNGSHGKLGGNSSVCGSGRGTNSSIERLPITTPAACMEVCLGSPSRRLDISIRYFTCSSSLYSFFRSGLTVRAFQCHSQIIRDHFAIESHMA